MQRKWGNMDKQPSPTLITLEFNRVSELSNEAKDFATQKINGTDINQGYISDLATMTTRWSSSREGLVASCGWLPS